jgi:hypothetical protein
LTLGHSANAIALLVPTAPAVHDAPDLKAHCFNFMSDLLLEHAVQYSSAELIATCNHIPGSSYNANQEATTICSSIHSAFFTFTNLTDLGFRDHQGRPITTPITVDPTTCPTGITYFAFRSTVDPSTIDTRIMKSSITIEFWLALPQTILTVARPAADPGRRNLTFESPAGSLAPGQASSTIPLRRTALQALSPEDLADLPQLVLPPLPTTIQNVTICSLQSSSKPFISATQESFLSLPLFSPLSCYRLA